MQVILIVYIFSFFIWSIKIIYWLVKNLPNIPDSKICKLIGTTKKTVQSIRDRSYWNIQNIRSQNPYELGLCTKTEIEDIIEKYKNTD